MPYKFLKILLFIPILFFIQNCGYQPLLSGKFQKFSINSFEITGDKKLGRILANKFNKIKGEQNTLTLKINASKLREISTKSATGSTTEYNVKISFDIEAVSDFDNKSIFLKTFSENRTLKASTLHVDTLNREKTIIQDIVNTINDELTRQLNLIYK